MSKKRLCVLWLDDEHDNFSELKAYFFNHSIDVECYKSQSGALEALKKGTSRFDAVLCDIQILDYEESTNESNRHFIPFINGLNSLELKFDPVIFTGQGEKNRGEIDIMLEILKGKTVFYKSDPDVQPKIVTALNLKAASRPLFNVKISFEHVYNLYEHGHIDDLALAPFKEYFILNRLNLESCNQLRQSLESLYNNLVSARILPKEVYNNSTEGKNAVDFLMCKAVNGLQLEAKFKVNSNVIRWLTNQYYDCSLGSHIPDDSYELRELVEDVGTDLHHSVLSNLFRFEEIARYFVYWIRLVIESEEFKTNSHILKSAPIMSTEIIARITNINNAGNGFAKSRDEIDYFIPSSLISPNLKVGDVILISAIEPQVGQLSKVSDFTNINA